MRISFITPIYNTEARLLKKSLSSIEKLNIENYEVIWINDGSKNEETNTYCRKISKINDHVQYVEQENQGSAVARNNALDIATGDYIVFVDADDTIIDGFNFEDDILCNDIVCYNYRWISDSVTKEVKAGMEFGDISDKKSKIISNILYNPNIYKPYDFGTIWSKCFSKKFLDMNKIRFRSELRKTQDRIFMLEAVNAANNIWYSSKSMYGYYQNNDSITHKFNDKVIDYYRLLIDVEKDILSQDSFSKYSLEDKYFNYSVFIETLPLTYFHDDCKLSIFKRRRGFLELYEIYGLDDKLEKLKLSDFSSIKQKIKYLLIKNKLFFMLYILLK